MIAIIHPTCILNEAHNIVAFYVQKEAILAAKVDLFDALNYKVIKHVVDERSFEAVFSLDMRTSIVNQSLSIPLLCSFEAELALNKFSVTRIHNLGLLMIIRKRLISKNRNKGGEGQEESSLSFEKTILRAMLFEKEKSIRLLGSVEEEWTKITEHIKKVFPEALEHADSEWDAILARKAELDQGKMFRKVPQTIGSLALDSVDAEPNRSVKAGVKDERRIGSRTQLALRMEDVYRRVFCMMTR